VGVAAASFVLAGCGNEDAPASGNGGVTVSPTSGPESTDPVPPDEPTTGAPDPIVEQAIADLAQRESADPADVTVSEAMAVTWRDGSIGCAQKGTMYTDALVDGYLIVLEIDGEQYQYHQGSMADPSAPPFYCANPTEEPLTREG